MKKLFTAWGALNSELSLTQKFALRFVIGTAGFIFVGFLVLVLMMLNRGKPALYPNDTLAAKESFILPKGAVIQSVFANEKESFVFKVNYNKKDYLYLYTIGQNEPQHIVKIDYK